MKRLYIRLFHGRVHPNEELDDWGFEGPLVGPISFFHQAYQGEPDYAFEPSKEGTTNALKLGFSRTDADDQTFQYNGDLIKFEGFYFGDFEIANFDDAEARRHNTEWFGKTKLLELSRQARFLKNELERLLSSQEAT